MPTSPNEIQVTVRPQQLNVNVNPTGQINVNVSGGQSIGITTEGIRPTDINIGGFIGSSSDYLFRHESGLFYPMGNPSGFITESNALLSNKFTGTALLSPVSTMGETYALTGCYYEMPANFVTTGMRIRTSCLLTYTKAASSPNLIVNLAIGETSIASLSQPILINSLTGVGLFEGFITVIFIQGSGAHIRAALGGQTFNMGVLSNVNPTYVNPNPIIINPTLPNVISMTARLAVGGTYNLLAISQGWLEVSR